MEENKENKMKEEETIENKQPVSRGENSNVQSNLNNENSTIVKVSNNNSLNNINKLEILVIVIIILLVMGLVYMLFFYNDKTTPKNNDNLREQENDKDTKEDNNENEKEEKQGDYELIVYVAREGNWSQIFANPTDNATKVGIKVNSSNAKFITSEGDNTGSFFLYNDKGIKLYDLNNKKSMNIDISDNYSEYYLILSNDEKSVIGIAYNDKDHLATYYNLKTKKEMYKNKYKMPENKFFAGVDDNYIYALTKDMTYLLSTNSEKVIKSVKNDSDSYFGHIYSSYGKNDKHIYTLEMCFEDGCTIEKIYNNQLNEFFSGNVDEERNFYIYNEAIYLNDNNKIKKYNMDGKLLETKDFEGEIVRVIRDYVVYVNNQKVILENVDDSSEIKEISPITEKDNISTYDSGYYTREDLDNLGEKNKKEGLYIVIEYPDKDQKGNYGMEYCYTPNKQIIEYPIKEMIGGRAKPVLYLYPEKETNVTVKFEKPELLTTTYPKYIDSWNVKVSPDGDMKDKDGKYYYALYWDEKRYNEVDFSEGFYVESKDAIKFLEDKLTIIGLSDKERNEFIMYWLPFIETNKKNLIYFELTNERELGNKLIITPKPDSLLRVSIHIKKVNEKVNIKEQKLSTFTRVGFTAVEWGGMTY